MRVPLPDDEVARVGAIRTPQRTVVLGVWWPVLDLSSEELGALVERLAGQVTVPDPAIPGIDPAT